MQNPDENCEPHHQNWDKAKNECKSTCAGISRQVVLKEKPNSEKNNLTKMCNLILKSTLHS